MYDVTRADWWRTGFSGYLGVVSKHVWSLVGRMTGQMGELRPSFEFGAKLKAGKRWWPGRVGLRETCSWLAKGRTRAKSEVPRAGWVPSAAHPGHGVRQSTRAENRSTPFVRGARLR